MAGQNIKVTYTYVAGADLSAKQYHFVKLNSSGQIVASGDGEQVIGVLQDKPTSGTMGVVATINAGSVVKVVAGASVTAGDAIASDSAGKAITAASADAMIGRANTGGATGELIEVYFTTAARVV